MTPRFLITNHGNHSAEQWAMATAQTIFDIDPSVVGNRLMQAQKVQVAIAEALVPHHNKVQEDERSNLAADVAHILTPYAVDQYIEQALTDIAAAAKGTPWKNHFLNSSVQRTIKEVIANHFVTSQHVERLWHADRNPQCSVSQQYKLKF